MIIGVALDGATGRVKDLPLPLAHCRANRIDPWTVSMAPSLMVVMIGSFGQLCVPPVAVS